MLTTGFEHIVLTTLGIQKTPETSMIFWFFVGILLGSLVNFLVDHQGWIRRYRSPWSRLPEEFRPLLKRRFSDFIPVWGWIAMIRYNRILFPAERASEQTSPKSASPTSSKKYTEKSCQKKPVDSLTSNSPAGVPGMETPFFWVPPFLVEFGFGLFLAWYQAGSHLLTFSFIQGQTPLYCPTFNGLMIFFFVMILTASLTDLLDYVIPDTFMILGTLIGIFFATIFPGTNFHHSVCFHSLMKFYLGDISSGLHWNPVHNSLALNFIFLAWTFWCFAMLDRRFYLRLPPKKRYALFFRTLARSGMTIPLVIIWLAGLGFIGYIGNQAAGSVISDHVCFNREISRAFSLFYTMTGLFAGTLSIWTVRLLGQWLLRREAMGFGDVILMGVIGTYLGWQGVFVTFFVAPFFGLLFGIFRALFRSEREIPYGPSLCLAAVLYFFHEERFSNLFSPIFLNPGYLLPLLGIGVVLFVLLLGSLQLFKRFVLKR